MKKVYWRPRGISRTLLALLTLVSTAGLVAVEKLQTRTEQRYYEDKLEAARLAQDALGVLRGERIQKEPPLDLITDPAESGLIGLAMSPVTSDPGSLPAKQTSVNPNFAAVVVEWLRDAGVQKDDVVAVGVSGSFPAINVCVYAALQALELKPVIISSSAASQWGANLPDFLWLHMERILNQYAVFSFRSVAASIGGVEDRGLGMDEQGRKLLADAISASGIERIEPKSFADSIDRRMALYRQHAGKNRIKAYINVGGGTVSVGTTIGKRMFEPGLNESLPPGATISKMIDSVMTRFAQERVPVIHITRIEQLAARYGLPAQPTEPPPVGEGRIFYKAEYNTALVVAVLVIIVLCLYVFIRSELGYHILQLPRRTGSVSHEPMI